MAAIQKALGNLHNCIETLEIAAKRQEQRLTQIQQQDLFSRKAANRPVDSSVLAKKLDGAIAKIEQILSEG